MLINKKAVRQFALELARQRFNGKFTRVSEDFLVSIENGVKNLVEMRVKIMPSVGKTIK